MELIIAFVVLTAGAVLVLRTALRQDEAPAAAGDRAGVAPPEPAEDPATVAIDPVSLAPAHPNGDAPAPGGDRASDAAAPVEAETLTAAFAPPPFPLLPAPSPEPPVEVPQTERGTPVAVQARPIAITEDRRLDDVLTAAEETATPPKHPALRLFAAISGLSLAFAAAMLLLIRGIQAGFNQLFGS